MKISPSDLSEERLQKLQKQIEGHKKKIAKVTEFLSNKSFTPFFRRPTYQRRKKGSDDPFICIGMSRSAGDGIIQRAVQKARGILGWDYTIYDGRHSGGNLVNDHGPSLGNFIRFPLRGGM